MQIGTVREPALRVQIVAQRSTFDENPADFRDKYDNTQQALTNKIIDARKRLKQVRAYPDSWRHVSTVCTVTWFIAVCTLNSASSCLDRE